MGDDAMMRSAKSQAGRDHVVPLNGLRFHFTTWGDSNLPLLLCLHGLRSYGRTFEPLAMRLSDRFHVLALDQRGRGDTDWDPDWNYYIDEYVADLEALVAYVGCGTFHLLGHSMGGANALLFAHRNPDRLESIILEDSGPGASQASSSGVQRIVKELENTPKSFHTWGEAEAFWRSVRPNVTDDAIASRVANSLRETEDGIAWKHDQAGIAHCRISPAKGRETPDLWPAVDAVRCPGLVLRGQNSDYLSRETAEEICNRNPNFRVREIASAGHYIHDDNPAEFVETVDAFLNEIVNP